MMDWLTLVDPPKWGWTAIGGVQDVLPPHERARRKSEVVAAKEQRRQEEQSEPMAAIEQEGKKNTNSSSSSSTSWIDAYYDNLIAGEEPRSTTTHQLLPNKALTTVMDTNHYWDPNTVARILIRFPLTDADEQQPDTKPNSDEQEEDPRQEEAAATTAVEGSTSGGAARNSGGSSGTNPSSNTLTRATSSLSRRSSTMSTASCSTANISGRNRTSTHTVGATTNAAAVGDWFEEHIEWDLGDPTTLSPEVFSSRVAQQFGLSWNQMIDLQLSIEEQLLIFINQKNNYRPPITVKEPSGHFNRLDDENYSITQVVQHNSTPGIFYPTRSGGTTATSSRPRYYPSTSSMISNTSESTRQQGGGSKSNNASSSSRRARSVGSAESTTVKHTHSPFFTQQVLDRLKQQSIEERQQMESLVTPKNMSNAVCHICHARKPSCLLFACGITQHAYCATHMTTRLDISVLDVCNSNNTMYHEGFCPVCTLHCACAKCGRRVEKLLDYVASLCLVSSSSSETATDNDTVVTQLLPTLDLFPLAKGTKPIPDPVQILDSADIATTAKRRRSEDASTTNNNNPEKEEISKTTATNQKPPAEPKVLRTTTNQKPPAEPKVRRTTTNQKPPAEPKVLRPPRQSTLDLQQGERKDAGSPTRRKNVRSSTHSSTTSSASSSEKAATEKANRRGVRARNPRVPTMVGKANPSDFPYELWHGDLENLPTGLKRKDVKIFNSNVEETHDHLCFCCKGGENLVYFCRECPRAFHHSCMVTKQGEPNIQWVCPPCINGKEFEEDPLTGKTPEGLLITIKPPLFDYNDNKFQTICKLHEIVLKLKAYAFGSKFSTPVNTAEVKGYTKTEKPMDLGTVEQNIVSGNYYYHARPDERHLPHNSTEQTAHTSSGFSSPLLSSTTLCHEEGVEAAQEEGEKETRINYYSSMSGVTPITLSEAEEKKLLSDTNSDEANPIHSSATFGNNVQNFIGSFFSPEDLLSTANVACPFEHEEKTTCPAGEIPVSNKVTDNSLDLHQAAPLGDISTNCYSSNEALSNAATPQDSFQDLNHTILSILKDIELIYHNCFSFNSEDSAIYRMASVQRRKFRSLLKLYVEQDLDNVVTVKLQEYVQELQELRHESSQERRLINVIHVSAAKSGPRPKPVDVVDPHTNQVIISYTSALRAFAACTYLVKKCGYKEDIKNYQAFAKNVKLASMGSPRTLFGYRWLYATPSLDESKSIDRDINLERSEATNNEDEEISNMQQTALMDIGIGTAWEDEENICQLDQPTSAMGIDPICWEDEKDTLENIAISSMPAASEQLSENPQAESAFVVDI